MQRRIKATMKHEDYMELPQLTDPYDVAAMLGISERTVRKLAASGELPGKKIAGKWRFNKSAVAKYAGLDC